MCIITLSSTQSPPPAATAVVPEAAADRAARAEFRHEGHPADSAGRGPGKGMKDASGRQTILVVDDTRANIGFLLETLSQAGYRVRVAPDGDTALEQVQ